VGMAHEVMTARARQNRQARPKIAYLTVNDPRDRRSWSGTHYYMAEALQRHCGDVTPLGPIKSGSMILRKVLRKGVKALTGREYLYTHTISFAKQTARIAEQRLAKDNFDLIFAPAGSSQIAYLRTELPIVYLSDATVALTLDYHPEFAAALRTCLRQANTLEQLAIDRAVLLLYPSSWAAESARKTYRADPAKVHVVPFGANLDDAPTPERALKRTPSDRCRLLFVGVDWTNKGGDIAFETLVELERLGIPAQLTVVGCTPPRSIRHSNLRVFKFLNKNDRVQREQLDNLYFEADLFLLPTRADCYGIAFCEANAFGLPAIGTDTGGVSEIIRNGENGYLLPPSATGLRYARIIADIYTDKQKLQRMQRRSRESFDARLNWDAWGKSVAQLLADLATADQRSNCGAISRTGKR
jgi:glycosyltransferase involved in cell wall biosynthesis